ncbi:MAG TPA: hypothetical protein VN924_04490 [Bryobacteraceae bacterium]|nr:hypothetical protein [Bryobacteraceae bacterium]
MARYNLGNKFALSGSRRHILGGTIMNSFGSPGRHMQTLTLDVRQDHIDRLSKAKKPILSIAELIWNSVDADATEVAVQVNRRQLG